MKEEQPAALTETKNHADLQKILQPTRFGYDRLFPDLPGGVFALADLNSLAKSMTVRRDEIADSKIPAGYTYLGQFIDHEISRAIFAVQDENPVNVSSMTNARSSFFDLESLYGKDPQKDRELYSSNTLLKLGKTIGDGTGNVIKRFSNDLPRLPGTSTARLVDYRNDENLAVAQTHVAFIKFHNAVVKSLPDENRPELFERARKIVIKHFQWLVLHDYLPKIISRPVLEDILANGNKYYFPTPENPYMPVEFAGAAFRFGHSVVRDFYQWNRVFSAQTLGGMKQPATLSDLTDFTGSQGLTPTGGLPKEQLPSAWLIDWRRFYDFTGTAKTDDRRFNFARKIDTAIAPQLGKLRQSAGGISLPERNLWRGLTLGLPTGQAVAAKMRQELPHAGIEVLSDQQISETLPEELRQIFSANTPLWYYILAEAQIIGREHKLGDVGSRIVAETIIGLIKTSPVTYFREPGWRPSLGQDNPAIFGMTDLLRFVTGQEKNFDELDPTTPV